MKGPSLVRLRGEGYKTKHKNREGREGKMIGDCLKPPEIKATFLKNKLLIACRVVEIYLTRSYIQCYIDNTD